MTTSSRSVLVPYNASVVSPSAVLENTEELTLEEGIPWQKLVLAAGVFLGCMAIIAIAVLALLKPRLPAFMTTAPFRKDGALGLVTAKAAEHGQIGTQNPVGLEGRSLDPTKVDVLG